MITRRTSYKDLLKNLQDKERLLIEGNNFIIPGSSWYQQAIKILKFLNLSMKNKEPINANSTMSWNEIFTSLALLSELNSVLESLPDLESDNKKLFLSKMKLVFKGPLLMNEENSSENIGRNTLFELKIFSKLRKNGYEAKLHYDHPDISFRIDEREYVLECKRLYKAETLIKNIKFAIDQLENYSLNLPKKAGVYARYGMVVISLSRYFHSGDMFFDAVSEDKAEQRVNSEIDNLLEKKRDVLLRPFPINIPALILEFSDRGSIDIPYVYTFINLIETANGRYSTFKYVIEDLKKLGDRI